MASIATHKAFQKPSTATKDVQPDNIPSTRKELSVNDSGGAVASMPVEVGKARETVREFHGNLDKETTADKIDVNDSYKYSGHGLMEVPDEKSDERETSQQFPQPLSSLDGLAVSEGGRVLDNDGRAVGKVVEGDPIDLVGQIVNGYGEILDEDGELIGCVDPLNEDVASEGGRDYRVWGDDPGVDALGKEAASPHIDMRKKHYTSTEIVAETCEVPEKEMKVEVELPLQERLETKFNLARNV